MTLAPRQTIKLQTHFTAQLAQTVRLLQLTTPELAELIATELADNPALEIATQSRCPHCGRRLKSLACPICDWRSTAADEPIVYLSAWSAHPHSSDLNVEIDLRATETLTDYIWRQIAPALSPDDHGLADYVLANLDEHGFLTETPEACAAYLNVPLDRVRVVLRMIQQADPPGVGARDPRESLLAQLDSLEGADPDGVLARTLLTDHWEQLGQSQLKPLVKQLGVTLSDLEAALDFIRRNLAPYPALTYWHSRRGQAAEMTLVEPDAIIHAPPAGRDTPFSIELFSPVPGWLRVSERFKAALDICPASQRQRLSECIEQAELFVHGLEQRASTLKRLLAVIVREQGAYLLNREHDPRPMTRSQVARQLGLHESTVSRAVAAKIVALPAGQLIPLEHFFDQSLAARHTLKALIAAEQQPLSDEELAQALHALGHRVARRTVAKYREIEHIPPALERSRSKSVLLQ